MQVVPSVENVLSFREHLVCCAILNLVLGSNSAVCVYIDVGHFFFFLVDTNLAQKLWQVTSSEPLFEGFGL